LRSFEKAIGTSIGIQDACKKYMGSNWKRKKRG